MDEIAGEAEVNKALLYYYFKNKESLFFAVNLRGFNILNKIYIECSKKDTDPLNKLKAMNKGFFDFARDNPEYTRMMRYARSDRFRMRTISNNKEFNENIDLKEIFQINIDIFDLINDVVEQGIEDGTFRNDLDSLEISTYLNTSLFGVLNIDSNLKKILEFKGLNEDKILENFQNFIISAVIK